MLSERLLTNAVRTVAQPCLDLKPVHDTRLPGPDPHKHYKLYMHVPFCERLCPYCSFNRFPFHENTAVPYFENMRREMLMLAELGYDFDTLYIGGGTPTIMIDELCDTIDLAKKTFDIHEVSSETNPNHLIPEYLEKLEGRIQRLSVGVQSSNDDLLHAMGRYEKFGSSEEIFERIRQASPYFKSLNVDMIFNFPAQTEEMLLNDIAFVLESNAGQTTFYPLMCSPSVEAKLAETVGKVNYAREKEFYDLIWKSLLNYGYDLSSAWTFNRYEQDMIDEYVVTGEEYPAIGSGGITYLGNRLFVNTFSIAEYNKAIESGRMSLMGQTTFSRLNQMRYRFMMQLFGLRLDKKQFKYDFGVPIEVGLPAEMMFMRAAGAFDIDSEYELTLTPKGRYLMVVMMRQFFIAVNKLRDQARAALPTDEYKLFFSE